MPRDTCSFVLIKQSITDMLHLFLCLLSCRAGFFLLVFPFCLDLLCDGQAFLPADFLRYPRCSVAYKGGIIDFSIKADTIGNNVNMSVVGVLVRYRHPLVVVKSHSLGKQMGYSHKLGYRQSFLVLWCDTDFNTQELVPATAVILVDHFHFLIDCLWLPAAKIVEGKPIAELALSEDIVQSRAAMRYCLAFTDHLLSYLRPYISHCLHENEGRRIS